MYNRFFKNSSANAAIEFAIVLPFILLLLSGIINFGLILVNKNQLNTVAAAGIYFAFGNSSEPLLVTTAMDTSTNISPLTTAAVSFCECLDETPVTGCSETCNDGKAPNKYVTVTAESQVDLVALTFALQNPYTNTVQATIRTER